MKWENILDDTKAEAKAKVGYSPVGERKMPEKFEELTKETKGEKNSSWTTSDMLIAEARDCEKEASSLVEEAKALIERADGLEKQARSLVEQAKAKRAEAEKLSSAKAEDFVLGKVYVAYDEDRGGYVYNYPFIDAEAAKTFSQKEPLQKMAVMCDGRFVRYATIEEASTGKVVL